MARLAAAAAPSYHITGSLLIRVASIYGVVLFSSRLFRTYLLMYEKKIEEKGDLEIYAEGMNKWIG